MHFFDVIVVGAGHAGREALLVDDLVTKGTLAVEERRAWTGEELERLAVAR